MKRVVMAQLDQRREWGREKRWSCLGRHSLCLWGSLPLLSPSLLPLMSPTLADVTTIVKERREGSKGQKRRREEACYCGEEEGKIEDRREKRGSNREKRSKEEGEFLFFFGHPPPTPFLFSHLMHKGERKWCFWWSKKGRESGPEERKGRKSVFLAAPTHPIPLPYVVSLCIKFSIFKRYFDQKKSIKSNIILSLIKFT